MSARSTSTATSPASVKLDAATARALEKVAKASGKSPAAITRAALREFLEDYWDTLEVKRQLKRGEKAVPWEQVKKNLGLDR